MRNVETAQRFGFIVRNIDPGNAPGERVTEAGETVQRIETFEQ